MMYHENNLTTKQKALNGLGWGKNKNISGRNKLYLKIGETSNIIMEEYDKYSVLLLWSLAPTLSINVKAEGKLLSNTKIITKGKVCVQCHRFFWAFGRSERSPFVDQGDTFLSEICRN